jgi:hypothetical protein
MTPMIPATTISPEDREIIRLASEHLEHPSLAARLTSVVGTPMEFALRLLPRKWYKRIHKAMEVAIAKTLDVAVSGLRREPSTHAREHFYTAIGMGTGAVGGFFGLPALLVELPVSTAVMMSAIVDIARSEGEDIHTLESRMACMEVFALGGRSEEDDAADTGYYGLRLVLATSIFSATRHLQQHGLAAEGAPLLVELIAVLSSRFGVAVSEKIAAQLVPLLGAVGGAAINTIFIHHFQEMARHHFAIRRLERKYGPERVQQVYEDFISA